MSTGTKTAAVGRRSASGSAARLRVGLDVEAAKAWASTNLPGVEVTAKFGNASFSIGGKVFAFTRPEGLVLKLPTEALARVLEEREAAPLVMGKRTMREWVLVTLADGAEGFRVEVELMRVAMQFVAES